MRRSLVGVLAVAALVWWLWSRRSDDEPATHAAAPAAHGAATLDAKTGPLFGRVVRASDGAPIADAQIAIERLNHLDWTRSGADGRFEFGTTAIIDVSVAALGYQPRRLESVQPTSDLEIALDDGGVTVHGVVADVSGGAISGARVSSGSFGTSTGVDGRYSLTLPEGAAWLTAIHDDYQPSSQNIMVTSELSIDFALLPGSTLTGIVVDRFSETPLADIVVEVGDLDDVSDADGRFTIHGIAPEPVTVDAFGPGHTLETPIRLALGFGEQRELRIPVGSAYSIAGQLADRQGQPIVDAYVSVRVPHGRRGATTDRAGEFRIDGVASGSYGLAVSSKDLGRMPDTPVEVGTSDVQGLRIVGDRGEVVRGRVDPPMRATIAGCGAAETDVRGTFVLANQRARRCQVNAAAGGYSGHLVIDVVAGGLSDIVVAMSPNASVRGIVIDDEGQPFAGAVVSGDNAKAITDRDGHFTVSVQPGAVFIYVVHGARDDFDDRPESSAKLVVKPGEIHDGVVLKLSRRSARITGTVRGPGGPLRDVRVVAKLEISDESSEFANFARIVDPVLSGPDGSFAIAGLAPGKYHLDALAPRGELGGRLEHVASGSVVAIGLTPQRHIDVSATFHGAPLDRYELACHRMWGYPSIEVSVTSADGHYLLGPLDPGTYQCVATTNQGTARATVDLKNDASVAMELEPYARITGTVVHVLTVHPSGAWRRTIPTIAHPRKRAPTAASRSTTFAPAGATSRSTTSTASICARLRIKSRRETRPTSAS